MATYTSHLNLKLPDYSDTADIKDLNENFKKIDDAIASGGTGGGTGGGIVTETDPTVPSWAKQPSKPTYTAAEVGALPDTTVIPTVPSALPNPQPIVINGISYDGSERKEITVSAGDGGSITETDPTVPAWAKAENKPSYTAEEVGALPSTYKPPVTSVNGKTGDVSLVASDVGALPNTTVIPTVPTALKNPYPLTINGVSYDGSEAKTVTIESTGGGASVELDTTLTQYGKAADAGAVGNAIAQETAAREAAVNSLNEANAAQDTEIAKKANDTDLAKVAKSGSYDDLTGKPTIPNVPESLKNPNKLILTGAVTAEYDGSAPVSVEIPAGGGNVSDEQIANAVESYLAANPIKAESHPLPASETTWNHPELDVLNNDRVENATLMSTEGNLAHNVCLCMVGSDVANMWAENTGGGTVDYADTEGNVHSRLRFTWNYYGLHNKLDSTHYSFSSEAYEPFPAGTEVTAVDGTTYTIISDSDSMIFSVGTTLHMFTIVYGSDKKNHIVHTSGTKERNTAWAPSGVYTEISLVVNGESGSYDFKRINADWPKFPQINTKPLISGTTARFTLSLNGVGIAFMSFDTSAPTVWTYDKFIARDDIHLEVCMAGGHWISHTVAYYVLAYRTKNGYTRLMELTSSYDVLREYILPGCNSRPRFVQIGNGRYVLFTGGYDRGCCKGYLYDFTSTPTLANPLRFFNSTNNITDYVDGISTAASNANWQIYIAGTNQKASNKKGVSYTTIFADPSKVTTAKDNLLKTVKGTAPVKTLTFTGAVESTYDGSSETEVKIPIVAGSSWTTLADVTTTEETSTVEITFTERKIERLLIYAKVVSSSSNKETFGMDINLGYGLSHIVGNSSFKVGSTCHMITSIDLTSIGSFYQSTTDYYNAGNSAVSVTPKFSENPKSTSDISSIIFSTGGILGVGTRIMIAAK